MQRFKHTSLLPIICLFPLIIFLYAQLVFASDRKVELKIYKDLEDNQQARVVVVLKDDFDITVSGKADLDVIKAKVKKKQKKVLKSLSKKEFKVLNKYKTVNAFSGFVTQGGLKKLGNNPDVERVYSDKRANAILSESVPLIGANTVHTLLNGEEGYTGKGTTVCIPDTGVDYTHPDLGDTNCSIAPVINGITETHVVESLHPYSNKLVFTWTITKPGYTDISAHFENIDVEINYDFLYVEDADGDIVQSFTGSYTDIWSISVSGDTIKIKLVTDGSVTDRGFRIDKVLNGTTDIQWNNCGSIIGGYDFVNNDHDPYDDNSHGTHVAGIVASQNAANKGVAPNASIAALKVLDANGSGWFSDTAAAIDWCIDNKNNYNISVISMSLGEGGEHNNPLLECDVYATAIAISTAVNQGIFVTVASGNNAYTNGISYPACASDAVSVGGVYDADVGTVGWGSPLVCRDMTTSGDKIVCHTNRDEILDVLAPGALITSTVPGGGYATFGGTSMAAPHTAGLAALLIEKNPCLTPDEIKTTLQTTGINIFDTETGLTFPRIDALEAINSVSAPTDEICNNEDDDCDGLVDEGLGQSTCGLGVCLHTVDNCVDGAQQVCDPMQGSGSEICDDDLDNDCDGLTDLSDTDCLDSDGDGISDNEDNCPNNCNFYQLDADIDGIGDVCDSEPWCGLCTLPECELECQPSF